MNIIKKILIAIFCPIWFVFEQTGPFKLKEAKLSFLKYLFAVSVTAIIIVFVYYLTKEIL